MTAGYRKTRIVTRLHVVSKKRKFGLRWYVYAWRGGPCIHMHDGDRPVIGPELLDKAMNERMKNAGGGERTMDKIIDQYRASPDFQKLSVHTQRDYRLWLDRLSERFGPAPIGAFADMRMREQIILWRDRWAKQPRTADKAAVMASTVLSWCVSMGILSVNVASGIKLLHSANKADQIWERHHMRAFATAPAHLRDALKMAAFTGLRLGDLVRLDWSHIGDNAIILITKKRKGRAVIPITPTLRRLLNNRSHRDGPILRNSRGQQWTESGLGSVFQKAKPTGFDRTIHDLRGTYVTWLALKGLTDDEVARIIGWTAKRIAEIRARYVDEARIVGSLIDRLTA